jgi:hypothetical protein
MTAVLRNMFALQWLGTQLWPSASLLQLTTCVATWHDHSPESPAYKLDGAVMRDPGRQAHFSQSERVCQTRSGYTSIILPQYSGIFRRRVCVADDIPTLEC